MSERLAVPEFQQLKRPAHTRVILAEYVTDGLPPGVVAEVERLATELAALGLAVPRHECVYVCNVTWYG